MSNNFFEGVHISNIGIEVSELCTEVKPQYEKVGVVHMKAIDEVKVSHKCKSFKKTIYFVCVSVTVIMVMISFMLKNANAGMAIMKFEVVAVSDDTITVRDEYNAAFDFDKGENSTEQVGQEVTILTDFHYTEDGTWTWDKNRTAIISK